MHTTQDLAHYVYGRLVESNNQLSVDVLKEVFQTAFLSSLNTEEGKSIVCSIVLVDPRIPDASPPRRVLDTRWQYIPFSHPIEFTIQGLSKLALASDPNCSCLNVFPNQNGRLMIWGMYDQQGSFQSLANHEGSGMVPPGEFHLQTLDVGHILVTRELSLLAELNGGVLVEGFADVFKGSIVRKKLVPSFDRRIKNINSKIEREGVIGLAEREDVESEWTTVIRRLLLKSKSFRHGGAFLITDSNTSNSISTNFSISYDRAGELFENKKAHGFLNRKYSNHIYKAINERADKIDIKTYRKKMNSSRKVLDASEALTGAIDFIAALSRVDGLVLLDTNLSVLGFGCEIRTQGDDSCNYFLAENSMPSKGKIRKLNLDKFGTRHRSMLRYCSTDSSAIGFVVSSDGPVRAISRSGKRVYMWDNILLSNLVTV